MAKQSTRQRVPWKTLEDTLLSMTAEGEQRASRGGKTRYKQLQPRSCLSQEPRTQWFGGFPITWVSNEDHSHLFDVNHSWTPSRLKSW